jgi:hypothetical protein
VLETEPIRRLEPNEALPQTDDACGFRGTAVP